MDQAQQGLYTVTEAKYFPVWPDHTQSRGFLLYKHELLKILFQPKRAQWTGTQENLKRILQIWKLFLCFFKSEKETFPLSFCNKDVWVLGHKALPRQGQVNLLATLVSFHCGFLWIAHKGHYGSYVNHYFWTYGW